MKVFGTLENKMGKKISVFSKILLSDTGILEDKLDIILNSVTSIHVIEQREVNCTNTKAYPLG